MSCAVSGVMSASLVRVPMDCTLAEARELLTTHGFHHLIVTENRRLAGIVSDRDVLKAISPYVGTISETPRDAATLHKRVHQIMGHQPVTIHADDTVETAARLLVDRKVSCLPVVGPAGEPVGVVSWRDILRLVLASPADSATEPSSHDLGHVRSHRCNDQEQQRCQ